MYDSTSSFWLIDFLSALPSIVITLIILYFVVRTAIFTVRQQEAVIIERLGRFHTIKYAGLRAKIPFIDKRAATIPLRTMANDFQISAKTSDNVTVDMVITAQYHVSYEMGNSVEDSGIYRSYYMLQNPVDQMRDMLTDALRSSVPGYSLDDVFAKKDNIARSVNATVSNQMAMYGFTLVSTLITKISLPREVEDSMNRINAAQREKAAAQDLAEADRIKRVTQAKAEAEAMEESGKGIAAQRRAIASGIKDSLDVITASGVSEAEANQLFLYTQWVEMMTAFAENGRSNTVVLPSDFDASASTFQQMLTATKASVPQVGGQTRKPAVPPMPHMPQPQGQVRNPRPDALGEHMQQAHGAN